MDVILWLFLIPIIWVLVSRFLLKRTITWAEAGIMAATTCLFLFLTFIIAFYHNTSDVQILNGQVTSKEREEVHCRHSYRCMCVNVCTSNGKTTSCHEVCQTCYHHGYDVDWNVMSTVGTFSIETIDWQGLKQPPRWTSVRIGEPASRASSYKNYLKAAPQSLFNTKLAGEEAVAKASILPQYPKVYDYYRVAHAIDINSGITNLVEWDEEIDKALRTLGPNKEVNVNVLFIKGVGQEYKSVLERAWLGGKKNDVTIIIGVDGDKIMWVDAFSFAHSNGNTMVPVQIRDQLMQLKTTSNPKLAVARIYLIISKYYVRNEMENYKYLEDEGGPSATVIGWLIFISLVILGVLTYVFHTNYETNFDLPQQGVTRYATKQTRLVVRRTYRK